MAIESYYPGEDDAPFPNEGEDSEDDDLWDPEEPMYSESRAEMIKDGEEWKLRGGGRVVEEDEDLSIDLDPSGIRVPGFSNMGIFRYSGDRISGPLHSRAVFLLDDPGINIPYNFRTVAGVLDINGGGSRNLIDVFPDTDLRKGAAVVVSGEQIAGLKWLSDWDVYSVIEEKMRRAGSANSLLEDAAMAYRDAYFEQDSFYRALHLEKDPAGVAVPDYEDVLRGLRERGGLNEVAAHGFFDPCEDNLDLVKLLLNTSVGEGVVRVIPGRDLVDGRGINYYIPVEEFS